MKRKITIQEKKIIELLLRKASSNYFSDWDDGLLVTPMKDGGMGSLLLIPGDVHNNVRRFGKQVSSIQFEDEDGINVIASLNLDKEGRLYELDIWKTDFSELIRIPDDM